MELLEGLRTVRERMEDPDNIVKDPSLLHEYEDGGKVRSCIVGHCFTVRRGDNASELCSALNAELGSHPNLTAALAAGDHLKVIDAAIETAERKAAVAEPVPA